MSPFILFLKKVCFLLLLFNLKLKVNLKFYKSSSVIKVISPILPSDLTPKPNGVWALHQIRSSRG